MHTLHLMSVEEGDELQRVRAVREAMRTLGVRAKASHADAKIAETERGDPALLGVSDDAKLVAEVAAGLELNGCEAQIVLPGFVRSNYTNDEVLFGTKDPAELEAPASDERSPEEVFAESADEAPEPEQIEDGPATHDTTGEHPLFSTEAYETAMAMLAAQEGDPLKAAAHSCTLGRTTGDDDLYVETVNALIVVFPWISKPLLANGLIDGEG